MLALLELHVPAPSNPELHAALAALRHIDEQLVERKLAPRQPLLMSVAGNRFDGMPVSVGQTVFPGIRTHELFLLLPRFAIERERHDTRIRHPLHGEALRFVERAEYVDRDPGVFFRDLAFDAEHMHDRKDAGLA